MKHNLKYIICLGMAYDDKEHDRTFSRKHCKLLNGRGVSVFTHPSPEKGVLPSVFPNSATASSKPSFQNGFKLCIKGEGWVGAAATTFTHDTFPQWLSMDSSGTWGIFWPAYCPVAHIPLHKGVSSSQVIHSGLVPCFSPTWQNWLRTQYQ